MITLLEGIVGSTAYGLNHAGSDVDRLGAYAAPTEDLHGLYQPMQTIVETNPDITLHEVSKWCHLALKGNPTVMELLWLPDELYEVRTPEGNELINIRSAFLSSIRVRNAYLGYAVQQFQMITNRSDGSFSADTRKRTAKHARHLRRLCVQGYDLYSTGSLPIRVDNPEEYHAFGELVASRPDEGIAKAERFLTEMKEKFDKVKSPLPEVPDEGMVNDWLVRTRAVFYQRRG